MSPSETGFVVLVVLAALCWLGWVFASRLDRLHRKVAASRLALDAQLVRRASAALELAVSGELDPVSAVLLAEAAHGVLDAAAEQPPIDRIDIDGSLGAMSGERVLAESDLSATLRRVLEDSDDVRELWSPATGDGFVSALAGVWFRAQLARRFHNEAVAQAARVRRLWYVRLFRLAGRAPMPHPVDLDDAWPPALGRPTAATS
jgi:hypothetical protein